MFIEDFSLNIGLHYPFYQFDQRKFKRNEMPALQEILKERIASIRLRHPVILEVALAQSLEEEQKVLKELSEINFEHYYGQSIDKLLDLPVFNRHSWFGFKNREDSIKSDCLEYITFCYRLKTKSFCLTLYPDSGCINIKEKPAGIRNELLKKVKIYPSFEDLISEEEK